MPLGLIGLIFVVSTLFFIVVSIFAFVVLFILTRKLEPRPKKLKLIAVASTTPFLWIILMVVIDNLLKKSDTQLYKEIFGYRPTIAENRMLFDDFGSCRDREIYMRALPTDGQRKTLLAIPGLVKSQLTPEQFIARGTEHGFMWWISSNPSENDYCKSFRIHEAPGFNRWAEFYIAECMDAGGPFAASTTLGELYVIASHRQSRR